jgi:hypothetical protein
LFVGVKLTEQEADPALPAVRLQVVVSKEPTDGVLVNVTIPEGLVAPVALVSVTVAVHFEAWFMTTGVSQLRLVLVK